nr:MAG TPA: hypothetical protein [Caudoviricetes sp.]
MRGIFFVHIIYAVEVSVIFFIKIANSLRCYWESESI